MKKLLVVGMAAFAAWSVLAADATWCFRQGVGASPENPTLWDDPDNWVGGVPASGLTAVATFPNAGTTSDIIWVKLPDDDFVVLGGITHNGDASAKYRFIGGKGFSFGGNLSSGIQAQLKTGGGDRDIIFSPVKVKGYLDLRGVSLACPLTFEQTTAKQLHFYYPESRYHCELFAPCGGETRSPIPTLAHLCIAHTDYFNMPQNNDAHTGAWLATAGSKMLKWVSGKKGTDLAVGQYVHAEGIVPEGTYVEYVYNGNYIGLSQAALASSADEGGTSIDFDRCYYKLRQAVDKLYVYGNQGNFAFGERRVAENEMTLEIKGWDGEGNTDAGVGFQYNDQTYWSFDELAMENYPKPSLTLLPDVSNYKSYISSRGAHLRFTSTAPGGADIRQFKFYDSASYKKCGFVIFDTPAGVSSTVTAANEWAGSVGKQGAGDLTIKTSIPGHAYLRVYEGLFTLDPAADDSTLTKATLKGGAFRLAPGRTLTVATMSVSSGGTLVWTADATLAITKLTLASSGGAIIRVEEGATFDATGRTIPDGTVFEGPGAVTGLSNAQIKAYVFRDGVQVTPTGSAGNLGMTDTLSTELPTRISPAFWVSAKEPGTVIKGNAEHTGLITQWNDVRGTPAQGYHFATNTMPGGFKVNDTTYAPYLRSSNSGTANASLVMMQKTATAATNPGNSSALVWDAPIRGIKAVFAVVTGQYDGYNGGGSLLGSTERLSTCHFYRQSVGTCYNDRFSSTASVCYNAPYYINGQLPPDGQKLGGSVRTSPMLAGNFVQVVDVHPLGDGAEADCWGYQRTDPGAYGAWIGECLIYTNVVTEIERRHIENYLMQKWLGSKVVAADIVPDDQDLTTASLGGATLNVGAGDAVAFDSFTDEAGLTKSGAGVVYVKGLQTTGAFTVGGGTVNLTSCDATKANIVPAGALIHVDANDDESFPGAVTVEGGQKVKTWKDTDNPSNVLSLQQPSAVYTTLPVRKTDESSFAQPMKVVDYGAFHCDKDEDWTKDASGWWGSADRTVTHTLKNGTAITNATGVTSVFAVWGTAAGGNQLLGGWDQRGDGFSRLYGVSSDVAGNIAKPILNTRDNSGNTDPYRTNARSALNCAALSFMNGNEIVLDSTAPSGAYDVISFITPYATSFSSLACISIRNKAGGMQMGELIAYTKMLTSDEARAVDAYLNWKWFGRTPPAKFRPAHVGTLRVDADATLKVEGNAPLTVASLASGGGTVDGDIAFASAPELSAVVNSDGSIDPVTVSGSLDVSAGGTVRLGGATEALAVGTYELVLSGSIAAGVGAWTVDLSSLTERQQKKFIISASAQAGKVVLTVSRHGLLLMVR